MSEKIDIKTESLRRFLGDPEYEILKPRVEAILKITQRDVEKWVSFLEEKIPDKIKKELDSKPINDVITLNVLYSIGCRTYYPAELAECILYYVRKDVASNRELLTKISGISVASKIKLGALKLKLKK